MANDRWLAPEPRCSRRSYWARAEAQTREREQRKGREKKRRRSTTSASEGTRSAEPELIKESTIEERSSSRYWEKLGDGYRVGLRRLRRLEPPTSATDDFYAYVEVYEDIIAVARRLTAAYNAGDRATTDADFDAYLDAGVREVRLNRNLGFWACAKLFDASLQFQQAGTKACKQHLRRMSELSRGLNATTPPLEAAAVYEGFRKEAASFIRRLEALDPPRHERFDLAALVQLYKLQVQDFEVTARALEAGELQLALKANATVDAGTAAINNTTRLLGFGVCE